MNLKIIAKTGAIVSIILFCIAIGSYEFISLTNADKGYNFNLYSLVPNSSQGVVESDNISYLITEYNELNYIEELHNLQSQGISHYILHRLMNSQTKHIHGMSNLTSQVLVSFSGTNDDDEVIYFRTKNEGKELMEYILGGNDTGPLSHKKEKYRKKDIIIYPLWDGHFLATFKDNGFIVMSFQKHLIENVIDTYLDATGLDKDTTLQKILSKKKSHNYLTLYIRSSLIPLIDEPSAWNELDFHMNSDVIYLSGEMHLPDNFSDFDKLKGKLTEIPNIHEDSLLVSTCKDSIQWYTSNTGNEEYVYPLFQQCITALSSEASCILVTDMEKVANETERYTDLLPNYFIRKASELKPFILSMQLSAKQERFTHILVLTYKE